MTANRQQIPNPGPPGTPATRPEESLRQKIAEKAYEIFLRRGQAPGHDVEDWLEAERLLRIVEVRPSAPLASSPTRRPGGRSERKGLLTPGT
jgi:DUF2934 family protein